MLDINVLALCVIVQFAIPAERPNVQTWIWHSGQMEGQCQGHWSKVKVNRSNKFHLYIVLTSEVWLLLVYGPGKEGMWVQEYMEHGPLLWIPHSMGSDECSIVPFHWAIALWVVARLSSSLNFRGHPFLCTVFPKRTNSVCVIAKWLSGWKSRKNTNVTCAIGCTYFYMIMSVWGGGWVSRISTGLCLFEKNRMQKWMAPYRA